MKHQSWPDIENFHNVRRNVVKYPNLLGTSSTVFYRGKVKIHGTNAGIQVLKSENRCIAQSRSSNISSQRDNVGFAAWVESVSELFLSHVQRDVIIYGEWCGPGIMKGVAINKIPNKIFAIFAAQPISSETNECTDTMIVDPVLLRSLIENIPNTHVIPWETDEIAVKWHETSEELINEFVAKIDTCDPWVKRVFDIEGTGEGLVFYPISHPGRKFFSDLAFKAKGEGHVIVAKTKPAQVDPTVASNVDMFATMTVTKARCEQGVRAINNGELVFDPSKIGEFLKWMNIDIAKETVAEQEVAKLDHKLVGRAVQQKARQWFLMNSKKV
jgi:hypothetical protein